MKMESLFPPRFLFLLTWSMPSRSSTLAAMSCSMSSKSPMLVPKTGKGSGLISPSLRYNGFEYKDLCTTANLILSNCLPLMPMRFDNRVLVSLNTSPCSCGKHKVNLPVGHTYRLHYELEGNTMGLVVFLVEMIAVYWRILRVVISLLFRYHLCV